LAEDCLLPGFNESQLTRKLALKLDAPAAIYDPNQTLNFSLSTKSFDDAVAEGILVLICPISIVL